MIKELTPIKAIRKKCLECGNGQYTEVRKCTNQDCPLYTYRMGHNPKRSGIGGRIASPVKNTQLKLDKSMENLVDEKNYDQLEKHKKTLVESNKN